MEHLKLRGRKIAESDLDVILALQINIARAGEQERLSWWRVDATDIDGGGDFFSRLVGSASGLCAVEAAMAGAGAMESSRMEETGVRKAVVSLFHPDFSVNIQLRERWMHLKNHPEAIPEAIRALLDHGLAFDPAAFTEALAPYPRPKYESGPLGRKALGAPPDDPVERMQRLAALLPPLEPGFYPFPYYSIGQ